MNYCINTTKANLAEVQTTLHWSLTMIKPPAAVGMWGDKIHIRVQTTGVPQAQEENNKVDLQGHSINYVGKTTKAGSINMSIVEDIDAEVSTWFRKMQAARWSGDGNDTCGVQNYTKDLKCDLQIEMKDPADKTTQTFKLVGCLLKMNFSPSLGQSADSVLASIDVDYDDFHWFGPTGFKI